MAGTRVMGILIRMMARAMYFELFWKTGVRMRVLKYITTRVRTCRTIIEGSTWRNAA